MKKCSREVHGYHMIIMHSIDGIEYGETRYILSVFEINFSILIKLKTKSVSNPGYKHNIIAWTISNIHVIFRSEWHFVNEHVIIIYLYVVQAERFWASLDSLWTNSILDKYNTYTRGTPIYKPKSSSKSTMPKNWQKFLTLWFIVS